jgi:hypothetical protein
MKKHLFMNLGKTAALLGKYVLFLFIISIIAVGTPGCKTKKPIKKTVKESPEQTLIKESKSKLRTLLADNGNMSIEEKERILADIKGKNLNDPELNQLIKDAENKIEKQKQEIIEKERKEKEVKPKATLHTYFDEIINTTNRSSVDGMIGDAIKLCESEDTPVLIIIAEENGEPDYDEPTTIKKYLQYLKDQKVSRNEIKKLEFNEVGKVKLVELKRKK